MSGSNKAAAGIGLSRVFGLFREIMIGATLGGTGTADAFRQAMRIPNVIQNLLGEGSLGASFVPVYAGLLEDHDEQAARRLAAGVLGFLSAAIVMIVALTVIAAGPIVRVLNPGNSPDVQSLATSLTRITAVGIGLLGVSAWCFAILNSHREYFLGYAAPVLWNLSQIILLGIVVIFGLGASESDRAAAVVNGLGDSILSGDADVARWLALAMVFGSCLQLGVMAPRVHQLTGIVRPHLQRDDQIGEVLRRFLPAVGARGVIQLAGFIDMFLASLLVRGSLALFALALPIYLLPISIFGFSVATTELTEMSRTADKAHGIQARVTIGLRKVMLSAGISTAVLVCGGGSIAATLYLWPNQLFGRGTLTSDQAIALGLALAAFGIALPASMTARISQNALYALGDTRTPAKIAVIRLVAMTAFTVLVMFQLDRLVVTDGTITGWGDLPHWAFWQPLPESVRSMPSQARLGVVGLGLGTTAGAMVEWWLLRRALNRKLDTSIRSDLVLPVTAASFGAGAAILSVRRLAGIPAPLEGIVIGGVGLGVYIGLLAFQGYRPRRRSLS